MFRNCNAYTGTLTYERSVYIFKYQSLLSLCKSVCRQEIQQFTPVKILQALSVPKDFKCLFYYAELDTDEYKRQGKQLVQVCC